MKYIKVFEKGTYNDLTERVISYLILIGQDINIRYKDVKFYENRCCFAIPNDYNEEIFIQLIDNDLEKKVFIETIYKE
jgi:hypothetical protein